MSYKQSKNSVLESRTWKITFLIGVGTKIDLIDIAPLIPNYVLTVPAVKVLIVPPNRAIYALA
jgi:hypothetical protein